MQHRVVADLDHLGAVGRRKGREGSGRLQSLLGAVGLQVALGPAHRTYKTGRLKGVKQSFSSSLVMISAMLCLTHLSRCKDAGIELEEDHIFRDEVGDSLRLFRRQLSPNFPGEAVKCLSGPEIAAEGQGRRLTLLFLQGNVMQQEPCIVFLARRVLRSGLLGPQRPLQLLQSHRPGGHDGAGGRYGGRGSPVNVAVAADVQRLEQVLDLDGSLPFSL